MGGHMTEINTYGDMFPLDETICKYCIHRMTRLLVPMDLEDYGLDEENLKAMDLTEEDEIMLEQHTCLIIHQDMDYLVRECNHFNNGKDVSLFTSNPYR
jgi:hypothetical protein